MASEAKALLSSVFLLSQVSLHLDVNHAPMANPSVVLTPVLEGMAGLPCRDPCQLTQLKGRGGTKLVLSSSLRQFDLNFPAPPFLKCLYSRVNCWEEGRLEALLLRVSFQRSLTHALSTLN